METLHIGVIGTGNIGGYHIDTITNRVSGALISAVFDVDAGRARALAERTGAIVHIRAEDLIEDHAVDAVLIASTGDAHAEQALACVAAGKPVLCEKPLAPSTQECLKVIEAEVSSARHLVQVGFMRRYDRAYQELKASLDEGVLGEALMLHCRHRNPSVYDYFTSDMSLTDSVVHEVDTSRWLLDDEIVSVSVLAGKHSPSAAIEDPQLVVFETSSGVLVDVESFVNAQYGYDVHCEVVGSHGVAAIGTPVRGTVTREGSRSLGVPADWKERFDAAYHAELQDWVNQAQAGRVQGADAWDGYAATAVAEAGLRARSEHAQATVELVDRPSFYDRK